MLKTRDQAHDRIIVLVISAPLNLNKVNLIQALAKNINIDQQILYVIGSSMFCNQTLRI